MVSARSALRRCPLHIQKTYDLLYRKLLRIPILNLEPSHFQPLDDEQWEPIPLHPSLGQCNGSSLRLEAAWQEQICLEAGQACFVLVVLDSSKQNRYLLTGG